MKKTPTSRDPVLYVMISIANCIVCAIHHGTLASAPLIYLALQEWFSGDHLLLLTTCGLHYGTTYLGYSVCLKMCHVLPARYFTPLGCVLLSGGIISSAYVPNIWWTFLTYGAIAGFGNALLQVSTNFRLLQRGCVTNVLGPMLSTGGFVVGVLCMPLAVSYFIVNYNYRGGMLMLGGLTSHGLISAVVFWPLRGYFSPRQHSIDSKQRTEDSKSRVDDTDTTDGEDSDNACKIDANNNVLVFEKYPIGSDLNLKQTQSRLYRHLSPSQCSCLLPVEHDSRLRREELSGVKLFNTTQEHIKTLKAANDISLCSFDSEIEFNRNLTTSPRGLLYHTPLGDSNLGDLDKSISVNPSDESSEDFADNGNSIVYQTRGRSTNNLHPFEIKCQLGRVSNSLTQNTESSVFCNVKSKFKRISSSFLKKRDYVISLSQSDICDRCYDEPVKFEAKTLQHRGISTEIQRCVSPHATDTNFINASNSRHVGIHTTPSIQKIVFQEATPSPTVQFQFNGGSERLENSQDDHMRTSPPKHCTSSSSLMSQSSLYEHACILHPFSVDGLDGLCDKCRLSCKCDRSDDHFIQCLTPKSDTTEASFQNEPVHEYVNVASVLNTDHRTTQRTNTCTKILPPKHNDIHTLVHSATNEVINSYIESFSKLQRNKNDETSKEDDNQADGETDIDHDGSSGPASVTHRIITVAESHVAIDTTASSISCYPSSTSADVEGYSSSKSSSSIHRRAPPKLSLRNSAKTVTFSESVDVTVMSPQRSSYTANLNDVEFPEKIKDQNQITVKQKPISIVFRFEVPVFNIIQVARSLYSLIALKRKDQTGKQMSNIETHQRIKLESSKRCSTEKDFYMSCDSDLGRHQTSDTSVSNNIMNGVCTDEVKNICKRGTVLHTSLHGLRNCKVECTTNAPPPWRIQKNTWLPEELRIPYPVLNENSSKCPVRNYNEVVVDISNAGENNNMQHSEMNVENGVDGDLENYGNIGIIPSQELIDRWCNIDLNSSDDTEHHCVKQESKTDVKKLKCISRSKTVYEIEVDHAHNSDLNTRIEQTTSFTLKTGPCVLYILSMTLYFSSYVNVFLLYPCLITAGMSDPVHVAHGLLMLGMGELLGRMLIGSLSNLRSNHKVVSQFISMFLCSVLTAAWSYIEDLLSFMFLLGFLSAIIKHGFIGIWTDLKRRRVIFLGFSLMGVFIPCVGGVTGYILRFTYLRLGFLIHAGIFVLATVLLLLSVCTWTE